MLDKFILKKKRRSIISGFEVKIITILYYLLGFNKRRTTLKY